MDGATLGAGVQARGRRDVLGRDAGDLRGPLGRVLRYMGLQFLIVSAPVIDEFLVLQVLLRDDVQPCQGKGQVGAGAYVHPVLGARSPPGQLRVHGDDLGAHLVAHVQPVAQVAVGVGLQRFATPNDNDVRILPLGIVVAVGVALGGVHDGEVANRCSRAAGAGQVAGITRRANGADIGGAQAGAAQEGDPRRDVAAGAVVHEDGLAAEARLVDVRVDPIRDGVKRFLPGNALPLVLAALAGALQRVLGALLVVHALHQVQAAHAQAAVRARIQRVALDLLQPAVLGVHQNAARVVAARGGVRVGAGDGVAVLFPLPLPLVVSLAVNTIKELLVVKQHASSPLFSIPLLVAVLNCNQTPHVRVVIPQYRRNRGST